MLKIKMLWRILIFSLVVVPVASAADHQHAWDLLKNNGFRVAYHSVLGDKKAEKWISRLVGPSSQNTREIVGRVEYVFANSCKPHSCNTRHIVIAYSPTSNKVYAKLIEEDNVLWLGNPPDDVMAKLEDYYAKNFTP